MGQNKLVIEKSEKIREFDNLEFVKDLVCEISKLLSEYYSTDFLRGKEKIYVEDFAISLSSGIECLNNYLNEINSFLKSELEEYILKDLDIVNSELTSSYKNLDDLKKSVISLRSKKEEWLELKKKIESLRKEKDYLINLKREVESGRLEELEKEVNELNENLKEQKEIYENLKKEIEKKQMELEKYTKTNREIEKNIGTNSDFYEKIYSLLKDWDKMLKDKIKEINR